MPCPGEMRIQTPATDPVLGATARSALSSGAASSTSSQGGADTLSLYLDALKQQALSSIRTMDVDSDSSEEDFASDEQDPSLPRSRYNPNALASKSALLRSHEHVSRVALLLCKVRAKKCRNQRQ